MALNESHAKHQACSSLLFFSQKAIVPQFESLWSLNNFIWQTHREKVLFYAKNNRKESVNYDTNFVALHGSKSDLNYI